MTMRSSGSASRYFRRAFLECCDNASVPSRPCLVSDFMIRVSTVSAAIDKLRQNVQVSTLTSVQSQDSGVAASPGSYAEESGGWPSPRGEMERAFRAGTILPKRECRDLRSAGLERIEPRCGFSSGPFGGSRPLSHQLLQKRHLTMASIVERGGRWMRITGTYVGPLDPSSSYARHHPFLEGGVRFKSKKKMKKAKAKKKETLHKIKRMRLVSRKRKEDMSPEEKLEFRLMKGRKKMELIKQAIAKFPEQHIPPEDPDIEVLTAEQMHYLKKIGYKNKNYVPVGRRGIYGGTIQNIHMHWKKHETVQVEIAGFSKEEIKVMAGQLARLSGGVLIDIHQKNIVILYRGRNYKMPKELIPMKTLDKRKALAKSKLEQSLKALVENDKKVEDQLIVLRKELAEGVYDKLTTDGKLQPDPKLEDPAEFAGWSDSEIVEDDGDVEDDDDSLSDIDVSDLSDLSRLLSESDSDSNSDSDSEKDHLEDDKAVEK